MKSHQGVAQAWATIDQNDAPTATLLDSYGVSGLIDNGNGITTISFLGNFLNTNYAVLLGAAPFSTGTGSSGAYVNWANKLVGSVQVYGFAGNQPNVGDEEQIYVAIYGDKV